MTKRTESGTWPGSGPLRRAALLTSSTCAHFVNLGLLTSSTWVWVLLTSSTWVWVLLGSGFCSWLVSLWWPDPRKPVQLQFLFSFQAMKQEHTVTPAFLYAGFELSTTDAAEAVVLLVTEHVGEETNWVGENVQKVLDRCKKRRAPRLFTYVLNGSAFPSEYREYEELATVLPPDPDDAVRTLREAWPDRVHFKEL